ncbi:hypothetical protein AC1031_010991 [Aphanomyces cochlioides]|nr:hypothetical protein AC1031_010991 [Aphanomyces cochlioides]
MQWPLANDLSAIASNASVLHGKSLIRGSPVFAYWNSTPEQAIIDAGLFSSPLGPGFSTVRSVLGPFGSVTMKRIPTPLSLRELYKNITDTLKRALLADKATQEAYLAILTSYSIIPRPKAWDGLGLTGGNFLCESTSGNVTFPGISNSSTGFCGYNVQEFVTGDTLDFMATSVVAQVTNISAVIQREVRNPSGTLALMKKVRVFLQSFVFQADVASLSAQAQPVKSVIRDRHGAIRRHSNLLTCKNSLLRPKRSLREVVSFQGNNGTITAMSALASLNQVPVNTQEVPVNVSNSIRRLLQYFVGVMLLVACVVCIYIVGLKGQIEGWNILVFSRVVSLVWVGRPLVFLRALSAITRETL